MSTFLTVAIPYVNGVPHLGYAYELIEADLAVRAKRALGQPVRFLGGTDDYSLKNVLAAEAAGESTHEFVRRHADRFAGLAGPLGIGFDDFLRTSSDPRHAPAVARLWRACAALGLTVKKKSSAPPIRTARTSGSAASGGGRTSRGSSRTTWSSSTRRGRRPT